MTKIRPGMFFSLVLLPLLSQSLIPSQANEIPYQENPGIEFDGVAGNEYAGFFRDNKTGMTAHWVHNGTHLFIALESPGTGWLSIGYGPPGVKMDGANIIIGYMEETEDLVIIDEIGVGRQHFPDELRGGTDNIVKGAGTEIEGKTVMEFLVPLDSGDDLDHKLVPGRSYGFFLAYQDSTKDLDSFHTAYSDLLEFRLSPIPDNPVQDDGNTVYLYVGVTLLALSIGAYLLSYVNRPRVYRFTEMQKLNLVFEPGLDNHPLQVRDGVAGVYVFRADSFARENLMTRPHT